ncbi:NAD-dependent deacylase [Marinobacteraceae bacterium S3BR75-40.1]
MAEHIVVLSGAGVSAESGLSTFRDQGGLWENVSVYDVATPEAFERDPEQVLRFYNERRRQVREAQPNAAHRALAALEARYRVTVITQNVDDLHERAGSSDVVHLHGELDKARSSTDETLIYALEGRDIALGDCCDKGSQLRPHVVWFGEPVPMIERAAGIVAGADRLLVVGTSLQVYPAASLVEVVDFDVPITVIDPQAPTLYNQAEIIREKASVGVPQWVQRLGVAP